MNTSKVSVVMSAIMGKIASIFGYVVGILSVIMIASSFFYFGSGGSIVFVVFIIFLCLSIFFIATGIGIKRRIRRFRKYVSLISTRQMTLIDNIAASTGRSAGFVRNDLQKMIDRRFLVNAVIDAASNEIIIGNSAVPDSLSELEMFTCSACGASGKKNIGAAASCEYCGCLVK